MKSQTSQKAPQAESSESSTDPVSRPDDRSSVTLSAVLFALGTFASRILGLVRDMMTARYFPNDMRDAFVYAFRLPNLFRRLLGEGALSISFIPVFVEILSGKGSGSRSEAQERARGLVASVFTILLTVTITLSLLVIIYMPEIMGGLLRGEAFQSVPGKFELTVRLGRVMFFFLVLVSLYAYFMAILNSLKKFALTAFAPCFFNIAMISAAFLSPRLAAPVETLAWAVIAGGFLQMAVLVPAVAKSGYFPRLTLNLSSPEVARVFKAVLPGLIGMGAMQLTAIANMFFTSYLPSGSQSYLYLADRLLELPLSLFVVSIGSALLPTLARLWADGDREAMGETINHYIRLIVFVTLPAALGLFFLAEPISEVLFLGREFKYADAVATAGVIRIYAFTLVLVAGVRILAQGFYAIHNTWFPALASVIALVSHVLFAFVLTRKFGLYGLASASVLSAAVNLMMLAAAYNSWVGSLQIRVFLKSLLKFSVGGVLMSLALQLYDPMLQAMGSRYVKKTLVLFTVIGLAGLIYMACAHVLRVSEYHETMATLRAKIRRKFARSDADPT